ncbi:hypothetical protein, partial [Streptomyces montanisoli]
MGAAREDALAALPVRTALPELAGALDAAGCAVLCAPPGTGKTTLVPLALAGLLPAGPMSPGPMPAGLLPAGLLPAPPGQARRVLVAEPRP